MYSHQNKVIKYNSCTVIDLSIFFMSLFAVMFKSLFLKKNVKRLCICIHYCRDSSIAIIKKFGYFHKIKLLTSPVLMF